MDKLISDDSHSFPRKKTLGELSTDSEQCCQDCGSVGHSRGCCACELITITFKAEPRINSIELMEEREAWQRGKTMMYSHKRRVFIIKQFMKPGKHVFKFLLNGYEWRLSPEYPMQITDKQNLNNFMIVEPVNYQSVSILSQTIQENHEKAKVRIYLSSRSFRIMLRELNLLIKNEVKVQVHGNWDNWSHVVEMEYYMGFGRNPEYYYTDLELPYGMYEYKFTIDGIWINDPFRAVRYELGCLNHYFNLNTMMKKHKKNSFSLRKLEDAKVPVTEIKVKSLELFRIYGHSTNIIDSKIWIFGGCFQSSFLGSMIKIDLKDFSVEIFEADDFNAPDQLGFHRTLTYGHKILMFGGHNEEVVLDKYSTFDTIRRSWTSCMIKNMPQKREMFTLSIKPKTTKAYMLGGYYCSQDLESEIIFNDFYALHLSSMYFEKLESKNVPEPRCHHTSDIINSDLYVFGGLQIKGDIKVCFNDIHVVNIDNHNKLKWKEIVTEGPKPCPRYGHIMVRIGEVLFINGGITFSIGSTSCDYLWDLWAFNTSNHTWNSIPLDKQSEDLGRAFHASCVYEGNIIIYGGKFKKQYGKQR